MENQKEIIERVLKNNSLNIKTRAFVDDLKQKLEKFGSLTEGQLNALKSVCGQCGIELYRRSEAVKKKPEIVFEEVRGSCGTCADGLVHCQKIGDSGWYVFKCDCDVGHRRIENYPLWQWHFEQRYTVDNPCLDKNKEVVEINVGALVKSITHQI